MHKRSGAGGKLNRSETVTVRLDPKLNYLCELAGRVQRRTKSSFIEAMVSESLSRVQIDSRPTSPPSKTIAELAELLWDVDEVERLRRLAMFAAHLMSYEDQRIWSVLTKVPRFWNGKWQDLDSLSEFFNYSTAPADLDVTAVRQHWNLVRRVAAGDEDEAALPQMETVRPHSPLRQYTEGGGMLYAPMRSERE